MVDLLGSVTRVPYLVSLYSERKSENYFARSLYSHTNAYNNAITQCYIDGSQRSLGYLCFLFPIFLWGRSSVGALPCGDAPLWGRSPVEALPCRGAPLWRSSPVGALPGGGAPLWGRSPLSHRLVADWLTDFVNKLAGYFSFFCFIARLLSFFDGESSACALFRFRI